MYGEHVPKVINSLIVHGLVSAGGQIETSAESDNHEGLMEIEVPFALPEDAMALKVTGDSMFPRYDDGDVIIVLSREFNIGDLINFEAVVTTTDGNRYLKRLIVGSKKGAIDLESFNAPTMRNVKILKAAPVHTVVRNGQWRQLDSATKRRILKKAAKEQNSKR